MNREFATSPINTEGLIERLKRNPETEPALKDAQVATETCLAARLSAELEELTSTMNPFIHGSAEATRMGTQAVIASIERLFGGEGISSVRDERLAPFGYLDHVQRLIVDHEVQSVQLRASFVAEAVTSMTADAPTLCNAILLCLRSAHDAEPFARVLAEPRDTSGWIQGTPAPFGRSPFDRALAAVSRPAVPGDRNREDGAAARTLVLRLEELCAKGEEEQAMDTLLDVLEGQLREGRLPAADAVLELLDPERVDVGVTLIALTITWYGRSGLAQRADLLERSERALTRKLGTERAEALLASRR